MSKLKNLTVHRGVSLTAVKSEIEIDSTVSAIWRALMRFGDVSTFHAGVEDSIHGDHSGDDAEYGAERTCIVKDGNRTITLHERITEFNEGESYRYEVFDWENFPLQVMFFGFEIEEKGRDKRVLSLTQNYRLKPAFLTPLMKGKIRRQQRTILSGYKNFIETGEKNVTIETIAAGRAA